MLIVFGKDYIDQRVKVDNVSNTVQR